MTNLIIRIFSLTTFLLTSPTFAATDPIATIRKDLSNAIFNFLYAHALCVEDQSPPCDWIYDGAYDLHRTAKELQSAKALKDIVLPVSDYSRGGYTEYYNPLVFIEHESLMWRIYILINWGKNGVPVMKVK